MNFKQTLVIPALALGVLASSLQAQFAPGGPGWPDSYPQWWYQKIEPASGLIDATAPVLNISNYAPLNQGQLKHITNEAIAELDAWLYPVGGADFMLDDIFEMSMGSNYAPANIGQLKLAASKFYERFNDLGFVPVAPDPHSGSLVAIPLTAARADGGTPGVPVYPWSTNQSDLNYAPANIGQAKHLFSWDLRAWAETAMGYDQNSFFGEVLLADGVWHWSPWFGKYKLGSNGWFQHEELGWLYWNPPDQGATGTWLFKSQWGWVYLKKDRNTTASLDILFNDLDPGYQSVYYRHGDGPELDFYIRDEDYWVTVSDATAEIDFDRDAMGDLWEIGLFGNMTRGIEAAYEDIDGDGISNLAEHILGTSETTHTSGAELQTGPTLTGGDVAIYLVGHGAFTVEELSIASAITESN